MSLQSLSRSIDDNLQHVRRRIEAAARATGRDPGTVRLVAVSKTHPAELIRQAASAGCRDFGESYVQDAVPKIRALADLTLTWHFIGAIQSNKTRAIAEHFQWVHTVSRVKIAERLSEQCPAGKTLDVTVQVNVDDDPAKSGVAPQAVGPLIERIGGLANLRVRGLMTILRLDAPPLESYQRLTRLFADLAAGAPESWDTLSMGMSDDFEVAITAGATQVRIGTAIFGRRT